MRRSRSTTPGRSKPPGRSTTPGQGASPIRSDSLMGSTGSSGTEALGRPSGLFAHPRYWPLATKVWVIVLSAILLAGGIILGVNVRSTRERFHARVQDAFAIAATSNVASVTDALRQAFGVLRGVAADQVVVDTASAGARLEASTLEELQDMWSAAANDSYIVQSLVDEQLNPATGQLRRHLAGQLGFVDIMVVDSKGTVVAATQRPDIISQVSMSWWASAYNEGRGSQYAGIYRSTGGGAVPASDTSQGPYTSQAYFEMAVPIYGDPANRTGFIGLVYARLNFDYLMASSADVRPSDETNMLIVDQQGQVVVSTEAELVGSVVDASEWQLDTLTGLMDADTEPANAIGRRPSYVYEAEGMDGTAILLACASMSDLDAVRSGVSHRDRSDDAAVFDRMNWTLCVYEPLQTAYVVDSTDTQVDSTGAPVETTGGSGDIAGAIWRWGIVAVLVVLGLALVFSKMLISPLEHFLSFVQRAVNGGDIVPTRVYAQPEVALLSRSFGRLLVARETLQDAVVEREDALARVQAQRQTDLGLLSSLGDLMAVSTQVDDLMQRAVEMIKARYHLYFVGLYLVDAGESRRGTSDAVGEDGDAGHPSDATSAHVVDGLADLTKRQSWAVLQAGTGDQGRALLAQGHRVSTSTGLVGRCLSNGQVEIVAGRHHVSARLMAGDGSPLLDETGSDAGQHHRSAGPHHRSAGQHHLVDARPLALDGAADGTGRESAALGQAVSHPYEADSQPGMYVRSEIAAPLRSHGAVLGALVAQSYDEDTFDDDFVVLFQIIADELAVAIESTRSYAEQREAEERLRRAYGELTREAWREMLGEQVGRGYEVAITGAHALAPLEPQAWQELQQEAWRTGAPAIAPVQNEAGVPLHRAVLPILARGEVIGVLDVSRSVEQDDAGTQHRATGENHRGSEVGLTADELNELEALTEQLGLALENARLYELARQRAAEEQVVSQLTQQMRETLSVEAVLQTAARELQGLLNLSGVEIRVGTEAPSEITDHHPETLG